MALEKAFRELVSELGKLGEALHELRITYGDKPPQGEVALVDRLGDSIVDAVGWFEEALAAAVNAEKSVEYPLNFDLARKELTACQERFNRMVQQYWLELVSYERIAGLTRFGRQRGGEWRHWTGTVNEGLERCREPLNDASQALFQCWQELTERLGMSSVSVQTTNIGQQITSLGLAEKKLERQGIT
jgi:hypothetical protein